MYIVLTYAWLLTFRLELVIEQLEDLKEDVNKQPESDSPPTHHTSTGNVSKYV